MMIMNYIFIFVEKTPIIYVSMCVYKSTSTDALYMRIYELVFRNIGHAIYMLPLGVPKYNIKGSRSSP